MTTRTLWFVLICLALAPGAAQAIKLNTGQHLATARVGLSPVGGVTPANMQLTLGAEYEYVLMPGLSPVGGVQYGLNFGSTNSLLLGLGARYRYQDLPWPVHVHGSVQLLVGELFNVRSVNLPFVGARLAAGADYYITSKLCAGLTLAYDAGATLSSRDAYYWQLGILLGASYLL